MWRKDGTKGRRANEAHESLHLGVSNEGDANREFSLHATREGLGASLSLVLKVQDTDDTVYLIWNLVCGVAFQLDIKQINIPNKANSQHKFHIDVSGELRQA